MRNTKIIIDLNALAHNLQQVKTLSPSTKMVAMVKANAYGHGAVACLSALQNADALGVACLKEAVSLQQANWQKPIIVFEGAFSLDEWQYASTHQVQCVIHHQQQLNWALNCPATHQPVWLKFNTGMNRLGFSEENIEQVAKQLFDKGYQIILTTHFANSDNQNHPSNAKQIQQFEQILSQLRQNISPNIQGSLCNSAGIVNFANSHHEWVRAGIMLYGTPPVNDKTLAQLNLKPVMQFYASIIAVHQLKMGECVGYGSRWQAEKDCQIAIVSAGYADGYPRVVEDGAYVMANGKKLPIVGRVAMDMLMIDISNQNLTIGTEVELWGNALPVEQVANWNDTISYELLCLVTKRPEWHYIPLNKS